VINRRRQAIAWRRGSGTFDLPVQRFAIEYQVTHACQRSLTAGAAVELGAKVVPITIESVHLNEFVQDLVAAHGQAHPDWFPILQKVVKAQFQEAIRLVKFGRPDARCRKKIGLGQRYSRRGE
jgi:hypothetical protein